MDKRLIHEPQKFIEWARTQNVTLKRGDDGEPELDDKDKRMTDVTTRGKNTGRHHWKEKDALGVQIPFELSLIHI